jgi:hypothetical protein
MHNMYEQPKYRPFVESSLWSDGRSERPLEPGVVAHSAGVLAASSSGRRGDLAQADWAAGAAAHEPPPLTLDTLTARTRALRRLLRALPQRQRRWRRHGRAPRLSGARESHSAPLRAAPDAHLFDVITNGHGVMFGFADRIAPIDRWAIVGYLRALQRSQHTVIGDVPADEQPALLAEKP